jgi:preprotein translocase subunit Sec61beta
MGLQKKILLPTPQAGILNISQKAEAESIFLIEPKTFVLLSLLMIIVIKLLHLVLG